MDRDALERRLVTSGWLFAVGSAVHLLDHLRRGQSSVSESLYWAGNLALVVQVVIITLAVTRHRAAPLVTAIGGLPLAVGFAAAHWLPNWSTFSDSFVSGGTPWYSLVASALEIVGALSVALAGVAVLRARALPATLPSEDSALSAS